MIFELERLADLEPGADIEWLLNQFVDVMIFYPIMKCPRVATSGSFPEWLPWLQTN